MRRLAVLALAGLAVAASTTLRAQIPEKFTNLQVLPKTTTRQMMKMVTALNAEVAGIGDPAPAGAPKITCFTCHRGAVKPLTAPGGGGGGGD